MRIHVLGREYDALRSGERFFANGKATALFLPAYSVFDLLHGRAAEESSQALLLIGSATTIASRRLKFWQVLSANRTQSLERWLHAQLVGKGFGRCSFWFADQ